MNHFEAKQVLLIYRPGTADDQDPQVTEALALAKEDPQLAQWLKEHSERQRALSAKFRQITPPAALKEQIISEHTAATRMNSWRRPLVFATALILVVACVAVVFLRSPLRSDNTLAIYRSRMVRAALTGYAMDLVSKNMGEVRAYLAQRQSPSDYVLPPGLRDLAPIGCAVEKWQDAKVTLVCFRTGKPLPPGESSDLWLFVVDRGSMQGAPVTQTPELAKVNQLITATWAEGDKIYLLGMAGDEKSIRAYF